MTPADHLTGQQARRRARWYRFRVWLRLVNRRVLWPAIIITAAADVTGWAIGVYPVPSWAAYSRHLNAVLLFLALLRWWQAERAVAIARQLQLDTRQGPLGMKGSTR